MVQCGGLIHCFRASGGCGDVAGGQGWVLVAECGEGAECFFLGYAVVNFDDEGRECFWGEEEFLVVWDFTEITIVKLVC